MINKFPSHPKIRSLFILGIILLITVVCYFPTFHNDFVLWDDDTHLLENVAIRSLDFEHVSDIFRKTVNDIYIPLTSLSFAIEYRFAGYNPFIYHLDNLLLHLLVTTLAFVLALRLGLSYLGAGVASLIFGIHPMHVESVAWVTERKDVLYAFFYVMALLMYLRYLDINKTEPKKKALVKRHYGPLIAVMVLGTLSMLAKPMALSLPLIMLLLDWFRGRKIDKQAIGEKIPLIIIFGGIAFVSYLAHARIPGQNIIQGFLIWAWSFTFYLRQFLFPIFSVPLHQLPKPITFLQSEYFLSVLTSGVVILAYLRLKQYRWFIFALVFYFFSIFFLLRYDDTADTNIVADRFMYLPSLGVCFFAGYIFEFIWKRQPGRYVILGCVFLLVVILGLKTYRQCFVWRDSISLWEHQLKFYPQDHTALGSLADALRNKEEYKLAEKEYKKIIEIQREGLEVDLTNPQRRKNIAQVEYLIDLYKKAVSLEPKAVEAQFNLGKLYADLGMLQEAMEQYKKAIAIDGKFKSAYFGLGSAFNKQKEHAAAVSAFEQTIRTNPEDEELYINIVKAYTKIIKEGPANPIYAQARDRVLNNYVALIKGHRPRAASFFNLGCLYAQMGDLNKAVESYQMALAINPHYADALYNLGNAYKDLGLLNEALSYYQENIKINSWHVDAYINIGIIYSRQGNSKKAREYYQKAIDLNSKDLKEKAKAYFNLAYLEEAGNNKQKAIELYQKSIAADPENAEGYYNLGNAYAGLRNYSQAIESYLKAVEANPNHVNAWINLAILAFQEQNFKEAIKYYEEATLLGYVPPPEFAAAIAKYR